MTGRPSLAPRDRFVELAVRLGADPAAAGGVFDGLVVPRHAEPHRRYHVLPHVVACLEVLDRHAKRAPDRDAIDLALWFHDAVYDPLARDNEELSAALLLQIASRLGLRRDVAQAAAEIVIATKHGAELAEPSEACRYALDADLSILGEERPTFEAYEAAIRDEYAMVPDDAFRRGRLAILEGFLARPAIYRTPELRAAFEARARENLGRSVARIRAAG